MSVLCAGNGLQGFQTPIQNDSFIVDGMGALGQTHTERGLTFYEVALSGHMCVAGSVRVSTRSLITRYVAGSRSSRLGYVESAMQETIVCRTRLSFPGGVPNHVVPHGLP